MAQRNLGASYDALARVDDIDLPAIFAAGDDASWPETAAALDRLMERRSDTPFGGALNLGDRRALFALVRHLKPSAMLEIGTHLGSSMLYAAAALMANAREGAPGRLVTVDITDVNAPDGAWARAGALRSPRQMAEAIGAGEIVRFVAADSLAFLGGCEDRFDFCFLDGSHSAKWVYLEAQLVQRLLNPGGVVLLHDYFPDGRPLWAGSQPLPGPWMALKRLQREGAPIRVTPLGALPWPTKAGGNVTSLALLSRS
ncbi:MAG: class I SAM-dependent methyltransferase [Hyphomonadaceae bacterium]|nr:class I SAM-dependent methyltransferase [Hyphomonadaceae bacterium]